MTHYEKKVLPLAVGDLVTHYDDGTGGYPEKRAYGTVTEIGDESFVVQWEDLKEETEYEWQKVTIKGGQIFDIGNKRGTA